VRGDGILITQKRDREEGRGRKGDVRGEGGRGWERGVNQTAQLVGFQSLFQTRVTTHSPVVLMVRNTIHSLWVIWGYLG
jgi:hypothetical protein